jgi:hypothetical protein
VAAVPLALDAVTRCTAAAASTVKPDNASRCSCALAGELSPASLRSTVTVEPRLMGDIAGASFISAAASYGAGDE